MKKFLEGLSPTISIIAMAFELGRARSTISRKVNRNGGYDSYQATQADQNAWDQTLRAKRCKLAGNRKLCRIVDASLRSNWSLEQISGW